MLNLKYKAYNNKKLKNLHCRIDTAGYIWNHCLALQKRYYKIYGKYIDINKMQKHISKLRKNNIYWKQLNSQSIQEICQRLDIAYQRFFKKLAKRPPKFKKVNKFNSFVLKKSGWKIENNKLIINKIGNYKFSKSREYRNIQRITIKRMPTGDIYFILTCNMKPEKYKRAGDAAIGIDFGLKTYMTCSDGNEYQSPRFYKNLSNSIASLNKSLSKKQNNSNNRKKAKQKLARKYANLDNLRNDYQWKLAHEICKNNQYVFLEDLNISAMQRIWGKKICDLSHSSFVNKLIYIANKYDTEVHKINKWFPSSKQCFECENINNDLSLKDRTFVCPKCGNIMDRDKMASKNILRQGIVELERKYKTVSTANSACIQESHVL